MSSLLEIETALNFLSFEAYWLEDTLKFDDRPNKAIEKRLQEIYIEYLYDDKLWEYLPGKYNPTILTTGEGKNKKNWTLIPYLTWLIAPIIYWIIVTKVFQRSGRCTI